MLEGFVKIPVLTGSSFVSITDNGLNFSGMTVFHMQKAEYINLFVNADTKQIAIKECKKNAEYAIRFFRNEKNLKIGVRFNNREIQQMIAKMMDWDFQKYNYKVDGFYNEDEHVMIFDLTKTKKSAKKIRTKHNKENLTEDN